MNKRIFWGVRRGSKGLILSLVCIIFSLFLIGCPAPHKPPPPKVDIEKLRPGKMNKELEAALTSATQPEAPVLIFSVCPKDIKPFQEANTAFQFDCGAIKVPDDHIKDSGKFVGLSFLRIRKGDGVSRPLLIIEQGGPGGSSMILSSHYTKFSPAILDHFDILGIEQRGTAWTRPKVVCDDLVEELLKNFNSSEAEIHGTKACFEEVSKTGAVANISTFQIASDLVYGAKAFGHEKFHFYGVSYGTLVGSYLLNYYPQSLERVVLDSPVVPGKHWGNDALGNADNLFYKNLMRFSREYANNGKWGKDFDANISYIREAVASLNNKPVSISYTYLERKYPIMFNSETFLAILFEVSLVNYNKDHLFYLLEYLNLRSSQPDLAAEGLSSFADAYFKVEDDIDDIMYQAIICREFSDVAYDREIVNSWITIPQIIPADLRKEIYESMFSLDICYLNIPRANQSKVLVGPVATDQPVLVVGGELDHVTSPTYVDDVSVHFSNVRKHVFKQAGHGVFSEEKCIAESVVRFLRDGNFHNTCQ